jgi:hypothetical protein
MAPKHRARNAQLMPNKKGSPKAAPLCAGRASSVSGSHDRRARGREDRANTQPLLWGRGMTEPQLRRRAAARGWATGWPTPRSQAPPHHRPQRRPSLEEQSETSTRFRSTKVEKGPAAEAARRGASRRVLSGVTTRRLCGIILHAAMLSITLGKKKPREHRRKQKGRPRAALIFATAIIAWLFRAGGNARA